MVKDGRDRTAGTGQMGQDSRDRTAGTGQPGQDSRDRAAETGQPGQDRWNRAGRTNMTGRTKCRGKRIGRRVLRPEGRDSTERTNQAEQDRKEWTVMIADMGADVGGRRGVLTFFLKT